MTLNVAFREMLGELKPSSASGSATPPLSVVLSSLSHGSFASPSWSGLTVRYVGRGTEHYRIDGKYYRVGEDQLMIAPQQLRSEVEIRPSERERTLGLCIFMPESGDGDLGALDGPIVLPAACELGEVLKQSLQRLHGPARSPLEPLRAAKGAKLSLRATLDMLERQVDLVPGLKRQTRFESARRLNLARAYLHEVTNRAVPLDELAAVVAVSPFQLLRSFRDCFGETPAAYHRRLRLTLGHQAVIRDGLTYGFVADQYGFAGGASFSHAFRRTFGSAPVREFSTNRSVRTGTR